MLNQLAFVFRTVRYKSQAPRKPEKWCFIFLEAYRAITAGGSIIGALSSTGKDPAHQGSSKTPSGKAHGKLIQTRLPQFAGRDIKLLSKPVDFRNGRQKIWITSRPPAVRSWKPAKTIGQPAPLTPRRERLARLNVGSDQEHHGTRCNEDTAPGPALIAALGSRSILILAFRAARFCSMVFGREIPLSASSCKAKRNIRGWISVISAVKFT